MAAGYLSKPGAEYGPCLEECQHRDCAATRSMAESECRICKKPIGYDRGFYRDEAEPGYVHSTCLEDEIDRQRASNST